MRQNSVKLNFSAGELSPRVYGRMNLEIFQNGCDRMVNFIAETQGAARYRQGTYYVHHTKSNAAALLIPFQFNDIQSYILEFTAGVTRIYKDDGIVLEPAKTITGATQADPVVITSASHGYNDGDEVFIDDVGGMTELNGKFYLVANKDTNTFELTDIDGNDIDGTGYTAFTSGGNVSVIAEFSNPYSAEDIPNLKYAQNADTMYFVHRGYAPYKLVRNSHYSWTFGTYTRTSDPFTGAGEYPGAVAFYEGRLWYGGSTNKPETLWGSRAFNSSGVPQYEDMTTGTLDTDAIYLTLAPNHNKVDLVEWLSGNSKFLGAGTFGGVTKISGATEDAALTPTSIATKSVDAFGCQSIMPISNGNLTLYMQRGSRVTRSFEYEFLADGYTSVDRNLVADHLTVGGIKQIAFQTSRPDILYAVRNDGVLLGLTYKSKEDVSGWHRSSIGGSGLVESVSILPKEDNYDEVWIIVKRTINGTVRRFVERFAVETDFVSIDDYYTEVENESSDKETFINELFEQQKYDVHLDSCSMYDGSSRGEDASASLVPAATTGDDIVFTAGASVFTSADVGKLLTKKYADSAGGGIAEITAVNSDTEVVCDILVDFDSTDTIAAGNWFITTDALSNLDYLEGETVQVVVDGAVHTDCTVTNGSISLTSQYSVIQVGYKYRGFIKTTSFEFAGQQGPSPAKLKNFDLINFRFLNSSGIQYGTNPYKYKTVTFRKVTDKLDRCTPLFSGIKRYSTSDCYEEDKHVFLRQDTPLPCTIQLVDVGGELSEDG